MIFYALSRSQSYLASVFDSKDALSEWVESVPPPLRERLELQEERTLHLPAFLIERNGFTWAGARELRTHFATWSKLPQADGFANLYFLRRSWSPPRPGTDYMGVLQHVHVTSNLVARVEKAGLDALFEGWLRPEDIVRIRSQE